MNATENQQNEVEQFFLTNGIWNNNNMYNDMGYQSQGNMGMMEPLAANDALGGFTSF